MAEKSDLEDRERIIEAVRTSHAAAKALTKDAAALSHQSALLKAKAAEMCVTSQETRAQARLAQTASSPDSLLTIPEAARQFRVSERTLRLILEEPDLQAQLIERIRRVGIYYKFIPLLPPDLMASLTARFAGPKG